jgi:hypothetical protein
MRFNQMIRTVAIAAVVGAAACGGNDKTADNAALQNDLSLAAQQQTRMDSVSALEAGAATNTAPTSNLRAPTTTVRRTTSSAPRRTTTRSSSSGSRSSGSSAGTSSGTVATSSGGEVVVQKNTKRDAAIGAAAGAVIGGATKGTKGAVIGGVLGGVLGGVIGNNVDVKKKPPV